MRVTVIVAASLWRSLGPCKRGSSGQRKGWKGRREGQRCEGLTDGEGGVRVCGHGNGSPF